MKAGIRPGSNIAMKVPPHQFEATVAFYRDVIGLEASDGQGSSVAFSFGGLTLWIDPVPAMSQAELWLELFTDDTGAAARDLEHAGIARCDDIEPLGEGIDGFWISSPAAIIHLVRSPPARQAARQEIAEA